jgi:molybdopterin-guanine dinucleotide biosynthesis protein A
VNRREADDHPDKPRAAFDALVLSGGAATRLGGVAKGDLEVGGRRLIERALSALRSARLVVVVGPRLERVQGVEWVREEPPGGGPVAALHAGLVLVRRPLVVVLAVDMPFVTEAVVERLVNAAAATDGAVLSNGRDQYLCAAYSAEVLRANLRKLDAVRGASMRRLLEGLRLDRVEDPAASWDCDTWEQVERARLQEGG